MGRGGGRPVSAGGARGPVRPAGRRAPAGRPPPPDPPRRAPGGCRRHLPLLAGHARAGGLALGGRAAMMADGRWVATPAGRRDAVWDPLLAARLAVTRPSATTPTWLAWLLAAAAAAVADHPGRAAAASGCWLRRANWWGTAFQADAFVETACWRAQRPDGVAGSWWWPSGCLATCGGMPWRGSSGCCGEGRGGGARRGSCPWPLGGWPWPVIVTGRPAPRPWRPCPGRPREPGHPRFLGRDRQTRAERPPTLLRPAGATVDAAQMLGPQLSGRDTVLLWGRPRRRRPGSSRRRATPTRSRACPASGPRSGTWNGAATRWPSAAAGICAAPAVRHPGHEPGATRLRHARVH